MSEVRNCQRVPLLFFIDQDPKIDKTKYFKRTQIFGSEVTVHNKSDKKSSALFFYI